MAVLGISFDSQAENAAFVAKESFPFPLLCDEERAVGLAYRACETKQDGYARRITYMIGGDGRIERAIDTQDPAGQADEILASLR